MKASSSLNGMIQEDEGSNGHITDGTLSSDAGECRRERRKQQQLRKSKRQTGTVPTKTFSPAVLVLLFGVFLSFLNVLRIMKNLEESPSYFNTASSSDINDIVPPIEAIGNDSDRTKDPLVGREPIVKIIMDAGISFNRIDDADLLQELPLWSEITSLYGSEPILHGLSEGNCQRFQEHSDKGEHLIGTAGTFNSGTNLLSELLIDNCMMPERMKKYGQKSRGIRWQVPWGKHSPAGDKQYREVHKTRKDKDIDANEIMPMVTIRDPLFWLKSMCRHHYTAYWHGIDEMHHCPNFSKKDLTAHVKYDGFVRKYNSLLDLWNQYYSEYMNIDIPVLIVRFEDLIFHTEKTVTKICDCAGGMRSSKRFRYVLDSAKKGVGAHGKQRTGFVDALVNYGKLAKRYNGYSHSVDLKFIQENVDPTLMQAMGYSSIKTEIRP